MHPGMIGPDRSKPKQGGRGQSKAYRDIYITEAHPPGGWRLSGGSLYFYYSLSRHKTEFVEFLTRRKVHQPEGDGKDKIGMFCRICDCHSRGPFDGGAARPYSGYSRFIRFR